MTVQPPKRVCLVTTGHPSTNPRLVKEADALAGAGYDVRVVACAFAPWAEIADAEFGGRPWAPWTVVRFGEAASSSARHALRARRALARQVAGRGDVHTFVAVRALQYVVPELTRAAARAPADLYVAHNLAALPAAVHAARCHGAPVAFDAEDFHRGERPDGDGDSLDARLSRWAEAHYIPQCAYVTAASDGIADAYTRALGIPRPTTILNVFPLADRDAVVSADALAAEQEPGTETMYWFSQTIGPGRGLEDAVGALSYLEERVHLALRGSWAAGYREHLMQHAERLGVASRIRPLAPVAPDVLVAHTACHSVGLALEQPVTVNRDLCLTNKLFTYLVAGVPAIATDTEGQRPVGEAAPGAVLLVPPGSTEALANAARSLLSDLPASRRAAERAARMRWNWEAEQATLLSLVERCIGTAVDRLPPINLAVA